MRSTGAGWRSSTTTSSGARRSRPRSPTRSARPWYPALEPRGRRSTSSPRCSARRGVQDYRLPDLAAGPAGGHADLVTKDGRRIGVSSGTIYSYYYRECSRTPRSTRPGRDRQRGRRALGRPRQADQGSARRSSGSRTWTCPRNSDDLSTVPPALWFRQQQRHRNEEQEPSAYGARLLFRSGRLSL